MKINNLSPLIAIPVAVAAAAVGGILAVVKSIVSEPESHLVCDLHRTKQKHPEGQRNN